MHADRCAFIETQGGQQNSRQGNVYQSAFELERKKGNVAYKALFTQSHSASIDSRYILQHFCERLPFHCTGQEQPCPRITRLVDMTRPRELYPRYISSLAMSQFTNLAVFLNIVQNAFDPLLSPSSLPFEHLLENLRPLLRYLLGY